MPSPASVADESPIALHRRIQEGVVVELFDVLQDRSGLTQTELLDLVDIPARTFGRRRKAGRFEPDESERIVRLLRIVDLAHRAFEGDGEAARGWLTEPNVALGDARPLDLARTGPGAREVEALLERIDVGVHS